MCKFGVGDVWMRTTPGVALWGGKRRRKYFRARCIWQHEVPTSCRNRLYPGSLRNDNLVSCVTEVAGSTREFLEGFLPLQPPDWTVQPRKQSSTSSHIQGLLRLSRTWECRRRVFIWMLLANYTIGHCLDPKNRVGKSEKLSSAEYRRTLTSCPATTHIGFRVSGGQREGS